MSLKGSGHDVRTGKIVGPAFYLAVNLLVESDARIAADIDEPNDAVRVSLKPWSDSGLTLQLARLRAA